MKYLFSSLFVLSVLFSTAQMDLLDSIAPGKKEREYVSYTFKMTHVINGQSVEMPKRAHLIFR